MLTLQRTATEMGVTLELERVHKAGPSLMGDRLIHFIFIYHIKYLLCVRQYMSIRNSDHNDNGKYVQCRISIEKGDK